MTTTEVTIEALEREIDELEKQIRPLADEAERCRKQILELKSPFKVGDTIRWTNGKQQRHGKVLEIREWCCGDPEWKVQTIKSDGTPGSKVIVHPYTKPTKV